LVICNYIVFRENEKLQVLLKSGT